MTRGRVAQISYPTDNADLDYYTKRCGKPFTTTAKWAEKGWLADKEELEQFGKRARKARLARL